MSNNQDPDMSPLRLSAHAQKSRAMWEASSDSYEERHATAPAGEKAMSWGRTIPEAARLLRSRGFSPSRLRHNADPY